MAPVEVPILIILMPDLALGDLDGPESRAFCERVWRRTGLVVLAIIIIIIMRHSDFPSFGLRPPRDSPPLHERSGTGRRRSLRYCPEPVRTTACGEPAALFVMLSAAVRPPNAAGLNVTDTVQLADARRLALHVVVLMKSAVFAPVKTMPVMLSVPLPVLVSVTTWAVPAVPTVCAPKSRPAELRDGHRDSQSRARHRDLGGERQRRP